MGPNDPRPVARAGLLVADHEKDGRRFLTVLDRGRERVTLLAPWEHAVLVLCDGSRGAEAIAEVVRGGVRPVSLAEVVRCLKFFEREGLIEPVGLRRSGALRELPGPRTLANMQAAFREFHADPRHTGRILTGELPFPEAEGPAPVDLEPTVGPRRAGGAALHVGSTFVVGEDGRAARSLLADSEERGAGELLGARVQPRAASEPAPDPETTEGGLDVAELLRAVDSEISAFEEEEATQIPPPRPRATGGEAVLPATRNRSERAEKVLTRPPNFAPTVVGPPVPPSDPAPAAASPSPGREAAPSAVDTDAPTLGGPLGAGFDEETMLVAGRRRAHDALSTREVERPARRGFDRLFALASSGAPLSAGLREVPAAELSAVLAHFAELARRQPDCAPLRALLSALRAGARGEPIEGGGEKILAAAMGALLERGLCPRCGAPAQPGAPCAACGFEAP